MMPVTDEFALRQFEIEALRQITDNLRRLNDGQEKIIEGQVEQGKSIHAIDTRLTRIESNSVNKKVAELELKVDALEAERDRRSGAANLAAIVFKSPALGWIAGAAITLWALLSGKVMP